jgi:pimeloyl-ACP methyl ester carboxylesterase/predicted amino acid-binding ACT domain protein
MGDSLRHRDVGFINRLPLRHPRTNDLEDARVMLGTPLGRASDGLASRTLKVGDRHASWAVGGDGPPVVFLHGWGLGHRSYRGALGELVARGCRVYAPALPGFGGTSDLPVERRTIEGYAAWVDAFLVAVGIDEPVLVIGHSFGGGVAIRLAHDAPTRVRQLVLINSVGHPTGSSGSTLTAAPADRPMWQYGMHFAKELFWSRDGYRVVQAVSEDLVWNMVVNPRAFFEIGTVARRADLSGELAELHRRELPILVLWGGGDGVLPMSSFEALCAAIGTEGKVLRGGHSWLLANPRAFSDVLDNVVRVQVAERETMGIGTTRAELRSLLRRTKISKPVASRLLAVASPLWLMSERPAVLAADLALCHPPLAEAEVRAVARPMDTPSTFRVTVIAADRPGLLADTAAALAAEDLTVVSASVATWTDPDIALHSLTVLSTSAGDPRWDAVGERLRRLTSGSRPPSRFVPTGRMTVTAEPAGPGRSVVNVRGPDALGLLEAISRWFAENGVSIEAAEITTHDGTAVDRFLINGAFEPPALASHLSRSAASPWRRFQLPRPGLLAWIGG